ncbi:MAG: HipA family kinase [Pirellula sp.]
MSLFSSNKSFQPTEIIQLVSTRDTGVGTLIVETDAGLGYLKALGNPDGPHALVKEFIGTRLADLIGLPTFDYALIEVAEIDDLPFFGRGRAEPGPAFVTRAEKGVTWGNDRRLLDKIDNIDVISGLIVIDTWLRNTDRYAPAGFRVNLDNVFFSSETDDSFVSLRAMDFSHCIIYGGELTRRVKDIADVKDEDVFGLFPEFRKRINRTSIRHFASNVGKLARTEIDDVVSLVPTQWHLDQAVRTALVDFLVDRAAFVADTIEVRLFDPPQLPMNLFDGGDS